MFNIVDSEGGQIMAEALEVHTLEAWKTISKYEAGDICSHYPGGITHKKDDTGVEHRIINATAIKGINKIDIAQYHTGKGQTIRISLVLNIGKLTGGSRIAMTPMRKKTAERLCG